MAELNALHTNTQEAEFILPNGFRSGLFLTLRHDSSPEIQAVNRKYQDKMQDEGKKSRHPDLTKLRDWFVTERLATHIVSWRFSQDENGEQATYKGVQPPYTLELGREIFSSKSQLAVFLSNFVEEEVADTGRFLGMSATV
jgi:hypothetical protein